MRKRALLGLCLGVLAVGVPVAARQETAICGTRRGNWREEVFLHRQAVRARLVRNAGMGRQAATPAPALPQDFGNIVVMEDDGGVVARRNPFNLDENTVAFLPAAGASYRYELRGETYDDTAATAGSRLSLNDDDSAAIDLPFAFPFFGAAYQRIFVNSDGNLTFRTGDSDTGDRSLGRVTAGPPRIAPLFEDLDPTQAGAAVRVLAEPGRLVVSWIKVPEYGTPKVETFQARLYPDGVIEFAFNGINTSGAIVGLAPGELEGAATLVDFVNDPSGEYAGAVAERFGGNLELDLATAAQRFYQNHADAYDYLVFFNNEDVQSAPGAVSYESTVRNNRSGYGDEQGDVGQVYGSASRLQAVLNMGPLSQFPNSPYDPVPLRASVGDTPVSIIAHEAGHLFLAYASIRDPLQPFARPMLGYQSAHWFFAFNSEASLLEGNRIRDNGAGDSPRFLTIGAVEGYSPLDQYLMGFRAAGEVEPFHQMFYATGTPPSYANMLPRTGVAFNGERRDVHMDELIRTIGRRTPDYTVAQRRFRFAFVLVVAQGTLPSGDDLAKLENFRAAFATFYGSATSQRAVADTELKSDLRLSIFPAAGVLVGNTVTATLAVETAPDTDLLVSLQRQPATNADAPAFVVVPAGATSVSFPIVGMQPGTEDFLAVPPDGSYYHLAAARVQVSVPTDLKLASVAGDRQLVDGAGALPEPVVVRLTDINNLPYPDVPLVSAASLGGSVDPAAAVTDVNGEASFRWRPGKLASNQFIAALAAAPGQVWTTVNAGPGAPLINAVLNGASPTADLAPGMIVSIYGLNLAGGSTAVAAPPWPYQVGGTSVWLNGNPVPVVSVSDARVNFQLPAETLEGDATLYVANPAGNSAPVKARVSTVAPGVFFDPDNGYGAVLISGTANTTLAQPAHSGSYLEIYCTGLGPVVANPNGLFTTVLTPQVTIGGYTAPVLYSGLAPGYPGLYQVNVQVTPFVRPGELELDLTVGGIAANGVRVSVR